METKAEITARKQKAANTMAKEEGYDSAIYETIWKIYTVYSAAYNSSSPEMCTGYPSYILISEQNPPRWATLDEVHDILTSL